MTKKSITDIKQFYPFNKYSKINLVSFKPRKALGDTLQLVFGMPMLKNEIDTTQLFEIKTLSPARETELINILMNYNFRRKTKIIMTTRPFCDYSPRNAILFYGESGAVIAFIEICFECYIYELYPQKEFPKNLTVGEFCDGKWELVKESFRKNGITFGI